MYGDGGELSSLIVGYRLNKFIGSTEDNESIAGDVGLGTRVRRGRASRIAREAFLR